MLFKIFSTSFIPSKLLNLIELIKKGISTGTLIDSIYLFSNLLIELYNQVKDLQLMYHLSNSQDVKIASFLQIPAVPLKFKK